MSSKEKVFAARREDLAFDFAQGLDEVFSFATFKEDELSSNGGIRYSDSLSFNFRNDCQPRIGIKPLSPELLESIGIDVSEFVFNVTLEDNALGTRKLIYAIPAADIKKEIYRNIDLLEHTDMSFHMGFEVKSYLSRRQTKPKDTHAIWHKSQVIFQKTFTVKASVDEALFDIEWQEFSSNDDKKDLLFFVDWLSSEVSTTIDKDCFRVIGNNSLKTQFKRLENNKAFGIFCIRMIASQIIKELLQKTLRHASVGSDIRPLENSLHDRFEALFNSLKLDFEDMAKQAQSSSTLDQLNLDTQIEKIMQRQMLLGSNLESIRFGGYN